MNDPTDEVPHGQASDEAPFEGARVHSIGSGLRAILAAGSRSYRTPAGTAELKIQRAKEHFSTFRDELGKFYARPPWDIKAVRDGDDVALVLDSHVPIPDSLALIAGDLLNNARSALDCVIVELAELGRGSLGRPPSNREERRLSFPIGEAPLGAQKEELLKQFLPAEVAVLIRLLQPFEVTKRWLIKERQDSGEISDDMVTSHLADDLLLRLSALNNWDKHRRLTFSFFVPNGVSDGSDADELAVTNSLGELADLRGIPWLGLEEPRAVRIDDPEVLADIEAQMAEWPEPQYEFHFSWWPLKVGDEIGRYIPLPSRGPVPDIETRVSLRLVLMEPDLFQRGRRMATSADRLLAEIIQDVESTVALLRNPPAGDVSE